MAATAGVVWCGFGVVVYDYHDCLTLVVLNSSHLSLSFISISNRVYHIPYYHRTYLRTNHTTYNMDDDSTVNNSKQQQNARRRQDFRTLMNAPKDIETNPKKYPKALVAIYNACKAHWEIVKDIRQRNDHYMYWNFPCLDWSLPANVCCILVATYITTLSRMLVLVYLCNCDAFRWGYNSCWYLELYQE